MQSKKSIIKYSRLPSEYQEVEYIESSGTQYIDTGIKLSSSDTVKAKFEITAKPSDYSNREGIYGTMESVNNTNTFFVLLMRTPTLARVGTSANQTTSTNVELNTIYDTSLSNGTYIENGITYTFTPHNGFTFTTNCYVFKRNQTQQLPTSAKLYGFEIVGKFKGIPCYRKSDNEIGLYDTVNNQFYTNAGTGTFTKGADIKDKTSLRTYTASKNLNLLKLTRTEWNSTSYQPADTIVFDYNKLYYMAGSGYIRPYDSSLNETTTNHSVEFTQTSSSWWGIGFPIKVKPSTKYTISAKRYDGNKTKLLYTIYNSDGTFSRYGQVSTNVNLLDLTNTLTMGANEDTLIVVVAGITQGDTVYAYDIQVEEGQTATEFMPYGKGSVKSICERIKTSKLPNAYQEVEWIKSNDNAYINPSVNITADIGFEVTANIPSDINGVLLGNYLPGNYFFFVYAYNNGNTTFFPSKNASTVSMNVARDTKTTFSFKNGVLDDGTTQTTVSTYATAEIGQPLYLFSGRSNNWFTSYSLYECIIYNGSTAIRDLIPCYRKSDNVAGLYDLVNDQFYTNAGTGTFSVGGDIN